MSKQSEHSPVRKRLPETRMGLTRRKEACGFKFYLTVNFFEDGDPAEVFIVIAKQGSAVSGFLDALAITISIALQYSTPWVVLFNKYLNQIFEPRDDINSSLVHAIAVGIDELIKLWEQINKPELERKEIL